MTDETIKIYPSLLTVWQELGTLLGKNPSIEELETMRTVYNQRIDELEARDFELTAQVLKAKGDKDATEVLYETLLARYKKLIENRQAEGYDLRTANLPKLGVAKPMDTEAENFGLTFNRLPSGHSPTEAEQSTMAYSLWSMGFKDKLLTFGSAPVYISRQNSYAMGTVHVLSYDGEGDPAAYVTAFHVVESATNLEDYYDTLGPCFRVVDSDLAVFLPKEKGRANSAGRRKLSEYLALPKYEPDHNAELTCVGYPAGCFNGPPQVWGGNIYASAGITPDGARRFHVDTRHPVIGGESGGAVYLRPLSPYTELGSPNVLPCGVIQSQGDVRQTDGDYTYFLQMRLFEGSMVLEHYTGLDFIS